ncbi:TPA: hypothetical protein ACJJXC_004559 [Enterobacter cloacae]|uniref:hypothetical protein n=1 Tax=Enterobacter cloacae TaxID=550 RepID=UPI00292FF2FA|nr:hypothetical protein [Enterobacter cloacae]
MITFTKEQLIASAHARIEFAEMMLAGELEPLKERTWSIELELARIALASLEAEVVCVIDQSNLDYLKSGSDADVWPASRTEMGDVLLYRSAPPAPVSVPDELAGKSFEYIANKFQVSISEAQWILVGWSACCAAMLQGAEPVTTANKLPEGWVAVPKRLTAENGAKAALIGEFNLEYSLTCHECFGEGCEDCNGAGTWTNSVPIDWTTIKDIWAKAIDHFAAAPQQEVKP